MFLFYNFFKYFTAFYNLLTTFARNTRRFKMVHRVIAKSFSKTMAGILRMNEFRWKMEPEKPELRK